MKQCTVPNCDRKHYAKGFCSMHYMRVLTTGKVEKKTWPKVCYVDGCNDSVEALGLCRTHYIRMRRTGKFDCDWIVGDDKKRIKANSVVDENGCWIWKKTTTLGYGRMGFQGKVSAAHRVSWILFKGEIPEGMQINHKCNVRSCVNPDHLYVGTQKDNMEDMRVAGTAVRPIGERNGNAKLTEVQVKKIRQHLKTHEEMAKEFGVSKSLISQICRRVVWKNVP